MALHLKKLCVGVATIQELRDYRNRFAARHGADAPNIHTTRQTPKRAAEIVDGGSLYWVINGKILCRQAIADLRPLDPEESGGRTCAIVMRPEIIETRPQPHRPFQGWRYLTDDDAPRDLASGPDAGGDLPDHVAAELRDLGLL
jgi:hypothetical protein